MLRFCFSLFIAAAMILGGCANRHDQDSGKITLTKMEGPALSYLLPDPRHDSKVSVEKALMNRRSHRSFMKEAISADVVSQMLWAAYGITKKIPNNPKYPGLRTAPSARRLYPLRIYIAIGNVEGIEPGVYRYIASEQKITRVIAGDIRDSLSAAANNETMILEAPACIFYATNTVVIKETGKRAIDNYVGIDLGHSAQNVYLQAEALGIGTCAIGGFNEVNVRRVMQIPENEAPVYLMPFGKYFREADLQ